MAAAEAERMQQSWEGRKRMLEEEEAGPVSAAHGASAARDRGQHAAYLRFSPVK